MSPQKNKVIIIGCGIAGPVIALLLKQKGYEPTVIEKVKQLGDVGGSLMMMPNGLKVLSLLGLDATATKAAPHLAALVDRKSTGEDLGVSHLPAEWELKYTQPACGVKRTRLNLALKEALLTANIPLYEDWKLASLTETPGSVIATSSDGRTIEGAFLLGCDGIKSVTRSLVLAQHGRSAGEAEFTGLTQTGGTSPTPISLRARPAMLNLYGPGAHFIAYPSSPDTISWAVTQKESAETAESWKAFSEPETAALKERLLEQLEDWCDPVAALVAGAGRLIKFGLFDRPQLEPQFWVSKGARCVLLGDAAHPTSPHLGQGANQALEDCYHLSRMLPDFDGESRIELVELARIFSNFAALRQPRTAELVRGARKHGEDRVVDGGPELCEQRDERLRLKWVDKEAVNDRYDFLLREPF